MQSVRLKLKKPYSWGGTDRNGNYKRYYNDIGFVRTDKLLPVGTVVMFEELNPISLGGDLSTSHYKYFKGKHFKSVTPPYSTIKVELVEV